MRTLVTLKPQTSPGSVPGASISGKAAHFDRPVGWLDTCRELKITVPAIVRRHTALDHALFAI